MGGRGGGRVRACRCGMGRISGNGVRDATGGFEVCGHSLRENLPALQENVHGRVGCLIIDTDQL